MKDLIPFLFSTIAILACTGFVLGALPPQSEEDLEQGADLVVTGTVEEVTTSTKRHGLRSADTIHRLVVRVDSVEKGKKSVAKGDEVIVRCWTIRRRPQGWVGDSGHRGIPDAGERCRFWLRKRDDGSWGALAPNGIEALDSVSESEVRSEE